MVGTILYVAAAAFYVAAVVPTVGRAERATDPSFWDAVLQLGYDPSTGAADRERAVRHLAEIAHLTEAVGRSFRPEGDALRIAGESHRCIAGLDAAGLYKCLPRAHPWLPWRGAGIQGGVEKGEYRLRSVDPGIKAWVGSAEGPRPAAWGVRTALGDLGMRIFACPVSDTGYRLVNESCLHLADFPAANVTRAGTAMLDTACRAARQGAAQRSGAGGADAAVQRAWARDFPHLDQLMRRYMQLDRVVDMALPDGSVLFGVRWRLDSKALKHDYRRLSRFTKRVQALMRAEARVLDEHGRRLAVFAQSEDGATATLTFRARDGRFLPLDAGAGEPRRFDLLDAGPRRLRFVGSYELRLAGIRLLVDDLPIEMEYTFSTSGSLLRARLRQDPAAIRTKGFLAGFIPIWLVNLVIPSNLDAMTADFLGTLAHGNNGAGMTVIFGSFADSERARDLWLLVNAEVASNGALRFAFGLQRRLAGGQGSLVADVRGLSDELLGALRRDYERYLARRAR